MQGDDIGSHEIRKDLNLMKQLDLYFTSARFAGAI
jgi:hypothetical protein